MAKRVREDSSFETMLEKNSIDPSVLKTKTGRRVRKDIKVGTLRKRSKK